MEIHKVLKDTQTQENREPNQNRNTIYCCVCRIVMQSAKRIKCTVFHILGLK